MGGVSVSDSGLGLLMVYEKLVAQRPVIGCFNLDHRTSVIGYVEILSRNQYYLALRLLPH